MGLHELTREDRLQLMKFVCSFAWADLRIADQERTFVQKMVRRLRLAKDEQEQVEHWLVLPPRAEELDPADIPVEHRSLFLRTAREMIEADGEISEEEADNFELLAELLEG
ncbi:MAG: TerB family tellurite resistance protein [Sandaracinaceae bacterium]